MTDTEMLQRIMKNLKCTEEEAKEILRADKAIDRGERMTFDLDPAKEKEAKKMANTGTRKITNAPTERKRKENPTKATIIAEITQFLNEKGYNSVVILNKERQIALKVGENDFEITLTQKRKAKK